MNYVMLSISPKEAEDICFGKQSALIRKRVPKTPATVYLYVQKKGKRILLNQFYDRFHESKGNNIKIIHAESRGPINYLNGKVIGEFKLDETKETFFEKAQCENTLDEILKKSNMTEERLWEYAKNNGFHVVPINDLSIYDRPRRVYDFVRRPNCMKCKRLGDVCEPELDPCMEFNCMDFFPSNFVYVKENK